MSPASSAAQAARRRSAGTAAPKLAVPALTAARRPRKVSTVEQTLDNGLRVIVVRRPSVPMFELRLAVPFFSTRSTHHARSMLLASTMLSGTDRHDRHGLATAAGQLGAEIGLSVDPDRLLLSTSALATGLRPMLDLVAEIVTGASYPAREVAGERDRLVDRTQVSRSSAGVLAGDAFARRLLPGHPYGQALPDEQQIAATTATQLRALHRSLVRPEGAVLVLVGDLSPARAVAAVQAALAGWTGAAEVSPAKPVPLVGHLPLLVVDRPGSVQTSLRFGGPALPRTDANYPALQLANLAFGGYFSSRWVENIRENKGYSYSPRSLIDHARLASTFELTADVATEVTAPAVLETLYELGRIATRPIDASELESVQQYAIGTLALATSTQAGLATQLSALAGAGLGTEWLAEHPARLLRVTTEEVAAAAHRFLAPQRLVGVAVGDAGQITDPLSSVIDLA